MDQSLYKYGDYKDNVLNITRKQEEYSKYCDTHLILKWSNPNSTSLAQAKKYELCIMQTAQARLLVLCVPIRLDGYQVSAAPPKICMCMMLVCCAIPA